MTESVTEASATGQQASTTEEEVWTLLIQTDAPDDVAYLVGAALKSDDELATILGDADATVDRPADRTRIGDPVKAYVRSLTVEGFRGIGPQAVLNVPPRPGLTVVSGRNGSGKSSFAEALEFAVTGQSYRWERKSSSRLWKEAWRNKHAGHPTGIRVAFSGQPAAKSSDSAFTVQLGVSWAADAELDGARTWAKVDGGDKTDVADLGWDRPAEIYRPILSYDELGGLFEEGQSALYDALNMILGLDEIGDAEKRIAREHKAFGEKRKAANASLRVLKKTLAATDDARAADAVKLLKAKPIDLAQVAAVATGGQSSQAEMIAALRRFAAADHVSLDSVLARIGEMRSAVDAVVTGSADAFQLLAQRTDLLRTALQYVDAADSDDCPVCETPLRPEWRADIAQAITDADAQLVEHQQALTALHVARGDITTMLAGLADPPTATGLDAVDDYVRAIATARALPATEGDWAAHLESTMPGVVDTAARAAAAAATRAEQLEDAWTPVAAEIAAWTRDESEAREDDATLARLAAANAWLKEHGNKLRDRRLAPIAEQARQIWASLRQESDVDLGSITLEGRNTSRRVSVQGTVDGEDTGVLSVMSQGELHALALALFIPRATVPASPFGFLVLDDPIQAMDPAKIDGFLSVLQDLAKTRQVIVFSHDDRLPAAIRRLSVDANLVEVSREPGSRVIAKRAGSPARRYIDDAYALIVDDGVDPVVKAKAAPGLFRLAIESAARERYFDDSGKSGCSHAEAESLWSQVNNTGPRVALAVHGDEKRSLGGWGHYRPHRGATMKICTAGVHNGAELDTAAVNDLRATVDDILERR
ncbi:AAA family ATPase [Gordonia sp. MP11Mi]|uniref:Nuclease SbcCD subunit C n=1 Tax=Gordonia sp. MP11Mi TaxID=3022769 RepID=A0AA97CVX3_9ACTN